MWEWFYNGYATMCIYDYMFVFHMDFSFHCSSTSIQKQHVSKTQALIDSWWPLFPCHNQCCLSNKENGVEFDHLTITYISHIAIITCLLFQVVQDCIPTYKDVSTLPNKGKVMDFFFGTMDLTNVENFFYTKQHQKGFETTRIWPLNPNIM